MRGYNSGADRRNGVGAGGSDGKPLRTGSLTPRPCTLHSTRVPHGPQPPNTFPRTALSRGESAPSRAQDSCTPV